MEDELAVVKRLIAARDRATERLLDADEVDEWLERTANIDSAAIRAFANHCQEEIQRIGGAGIEIQARTIFMTGFMIALDLVFEPIEEL